VRLNDRDYQVGDTLEFRCTRFTGRAGLPLQWSGDPYVVTHVLTAFKGLEGGVLRALGPEWHVMSHPGLVEWLCGKRRGSVIRCDGVPPSDSVWTPSAATTRGIHPTSVGVERLLRAVPTLRPLLPAMSTVSPAWAALVEKWDQIVKVMES